MCSCNKLRYYCLFRTSGSWRGRRHTDFAKLCNCFGSRSILCCLAHRKCCSWGRCKWSIGYLCSGTGSKEVGMSNILLVSHSHIYHTGSGTKHICQNPIPTHSHIWYSISHFVDYNSHSYCHTLSSSYHLENKILPYMHYKWVIRFLKFYINRSSKDMGCSSYFHPKLPHHHNLYIDSLMNYTMITLVYKICCRHMTSTSSHSIGEKQNYLSTLKAITIANN